MGKVIQTKAVPKNIRYHMRINVDETGSSVEEILEWCRENLFGTVYWDVIGFPPPLPAMSPPRRAVSRKKHFDDERPHLLVWFTRANDAAIYKLTWEPFG